LPETSLEQDRVEVPVPPATDAGVVEQVRLVEFVTTDRLTVLAKALTGEMVMVEIPGWPALTVPTAGLVEIVKSCTVKVTFAEWDSPLLVPVTVMVTGDGSTEEKVQERVAVPDPVTVGGVTVHEVLFVEKPTRPAKLFWEATVTLDVPAKPTSRLTLVGLADNRKFWTTKVTVAACARALFVPVTETWTVPAEARVHDSVALPDPETLVGLVVHAVLLVEKPTTPANPLSATTVTVDVPALSTLTVTLVGLAVRVKSWTRYVTNAKRDSVPLVPVTVAW
jgi:hypothetical protein